ncbi:hypothetical protein [Streptomyces sp. URMC 125]|uniref:hypothetical protein n=1 Tax=Streptomyces sp. URMC 125 TaxID=3423419 RepID=UPI003F1D7A6A
MLTFATKTTSVTPAAPAERDAVADLMGPREEPVSGAPVWAPEAAGLLLALILLSPKDPKEK